MANSKQNTDIPASKRGLKQGEERFSSVTSTDILEDLKGIAYWEKSLFKDVVTQAFETHIAQWKKDNPGKQLRSDS